MLISAPPVPDRGEILAAPEVRLEEIENRRVTDLGELDAFTAAYAGLSIFACHASTSIGFSSVARRALIVAAAIAVVVPPPFPLGNTWRNVVMRWPPRPRCLSKRHQLPRDNAARIELRLHLLEVLLRVQRGRAFYPWVDRIRSDQVEFLARRKNVVARVVVNDPHLWVRRDVVVHFAEVFRDDPWDEWLEFADHHSFYRWMDADRAGSDARSESDYQRAFRASVCSCRISAVRWPRSRWRRMSCGSVDASTLPLT